MRFTSMNNTDIWDRIQKESKSLLNKVYIKVLTFLFLSFHFNLTFHFHNIIINNISTSTGSLKTIQEVLKVAIIWWMIHLFEEWWINAMINQLMMKVKNWMMRVIEECSHAWTDILTCHYHDWNLKKIPNVFLVF